MRDIAPSGRHESEHNEENPAGSDTQAGWTLVEVTFAMILLSIGIISFLMALMSSMRLAAAGHERDLAMNAARKIVEQMRTYTISNAYTAYSSNPDFVVVGLNPFEGDTDGMPGKVVFPDDSGNLMEDQTSELVGTDNDLDLDGDGDATDTVSPASAIMLPVLVRVEWRSAAGEWTVEVKTLLVDR